MVTRIFPSKRRVPFVTLFFLLFGFWAHSQVPESFTYQAVARGNDGALLKNMTFQVRLSLLQGGENGTLVWAETQTVTTNELGLFTLQAGNVTPLEVDWSQGPYWLKVEIDLDDGQGFLAMGAARLLSVPYALYAQDVANKEDADADPQNEIQDLHLEGNVLTITKNASATAIDLSPYLDNPGWQLQGSDTLTYPGSVAVGTSDAGGSKLVVQGDDLQSEEPLFEVKRKDGQTVFAVYNGGVRIFVDTAGSAKGPWRSGFAIGGLGVRKGEPVEFFRVTPDSVRIYINDSDAKKPRGGFAIGGYNFSKGTTYEYFRVTEDSTRVYIRESSTKGPRGGFAIGGINFLKGGTEEYFNVSSGTSVEVVDPSQPRILWYPKKEAFLTGRVLVESPDSVGTNSMATGFESKAIGDYSQALGYQAISRGNYSIAIGKNAVTLGKSSFAFGTSTLAKGKSSLAMGDMAKAEATNAFAFGKMAQASGYCALALGYNTKAEGSFSTASGYDSKAVSDYSFSAGYMSVSRYADSTYRNYPTAKNGYGTVALGYRSEARGNGSIAMGYYAKALAPYSAALGGYHCEAHEWGSTALGDGCKTFAKHSFSVGYHSETHGHASLAMGESAKTYGSRSVALGSGVKTMGDYSVALGKGTVTNSLFCTAVGAYNDTLSGSSRSSFVATDPIFIVGNGTYYGSRKNALVILKNGHVGIGTNTPRYPLTVTSSEASPTYTYGYLNSQGQTGKATSWGYISIYASGRVRAGEFNAASDARIKHIIGRSDPQADLATLMKIRITDYRYIDTISKGSGVHKKVIAQELQEVYPVAVNTTTGFVPSVYCLADSTVREEVTGMVFVYLPKEHGLQAGDRVRLITPEGTEEREVAQVISPKAFVVQGGRAWDRLFVFGKEVDDFLTVDYEAVAMLNVSATQELAMQNKALQMRVEALAREVARLKKENAELAMIKEELEKLKALFGVMAEGSQQE